MIGESAGASLRRGRWRGAISLRIWRLGAANEPDRSRQWPGNARASKSRRAFEESTGSISDQNMRARGPYADHSPRTRRSDGNLTPYRSNGAFNHRQASVFDPRRRSSREGLASDVPAAPMRTSSSSPRWWRGNVSTPWFHPNCERSDGGSRAMTPRPMASPRAGSMHNMMPECHDVESWRARARPS